MFKELDKCVNEFMNEADMFLEKCKKKKVKNQTIKQKQFKELKVGEQFTYQGNQYTKLDDNGLSILDSWHDKLWCSFDGFNNDYEASVIRCYLKNNVFKDILKIKGKDVLGNSAIFNDKIFLLSENEYKQYKYLIKTYAAHWWLRSTVASCVYSARCVDSGGNFDNLDVSDSYCAVRVALIFESEMPVSTEII